jgi:hypothetical protein
VLFPKHGFTTAASEKPGFAVRAEREGEVKVTTVLRADEEARREEFNGFAGVDGLIAEYFENGELLVWNAAEHGHGFAVCLRCGYADSEAQPSGDGRINLPARFAQHLPIHQDRGGWCWREGEAPVLRHRVLAAKQRTDLLVLDFDRSPAGPLDEVTALTIGHALKQRGAQLLEVDGRELGVLTLPSARGFRAVIFDDTPGGSGHVLQLAEGRPRDWLEEAYQLLVGQNPMAHDGGCERACLACLLSFETERDVHLLDRRRGISALGRLLGLGAPRTAQDAEKFVDERSEVPVRGTTDRLRAAREGARRRNEQRERSRRS